jgi:hypothetical protein
MAATAGVYTPSIQAAIIKAQRDIFKNTPDLYAAKTPYLAKLVQMQTADVSVVTQSAINLVPVTWLSTAAIAAGACAPSCELDGPRLGTDATPMSLNYCSHTSFAVPIMVGDDPNGLYAGSSISYAETVAKGTLAAKQKIHEDVALKILAKNLTFAGINEDNTGQYGLVKGTGGTATVNTIPGANWNENIYPFFQMEAGINRMARPWVADGVSNGLYLRNLAAIPNAQNDNQRDQIAKFALINTVYDYFTFNAAGITNMDIVNDATSLAAAFRNQYTVGEVEDVMANHKVTAIPGAETIDFEGNIIARPLYNIDLEIQRKCEVVTRNGKQVKQWFDVYDFTLPFFDLLHDPYRLGGGTNTGTLVFTKGA